MVPLATLLCLHLCPLYGPAQTTDGPEGRVSISGVILDPDGEPLRDNNVSIWWGWWSNPRSVGGLGQWGAEELRTGPQGQFELHDIPPGFVRLSLSAPNMLPLYTRDLVAIERAKPTTDVVLRSPGYGGSVTGTVLDESGQPVADAIVTASSLVHARGVTSILGRLEETGETARTGPDGRFRLANVPPGNRTISAFAPGWAPATSRVEVAEGAHTSTTLTLSLCLPGTWTLTGRVVDARDRAVAGAEFEVDYEPGPEPVVRYMPQATTTNLGEFLLYGLPAGQPVYVRVYHPEAGMWQQKLEGTEGEYRSTTIRVPGGAKLRGLIRLSDGTPLASQQIRISLSGPGVDRTHWADLRFRLTTDEHGSYLICGLQPGRWQIEAEADLGRRTVKQEIDIVRHYTRQDIVFPCDAAQGGRVIGPDGQRLPNAWLLFLGEGARRYGPLCSPDGQFQCDTMDPGTYTAVFWASGFWPATAQVELPEGQRLTALHLRLGEGATVSGTVVDRDGRPLPGVPVHMAREGMTWADLGRPTGREGLGLWTERARPFVAMLGCMGPDGLTTTAADGSFTIRGVSAQAIGLIATEAGHQYLGLVPGFWRQSPEPVQRVEITERRRDGTYVPIGGVAIRLDGGRDVTDAVIRAARAVADEDLCHVRGIIRDPHHQFPDLADLTVGVSDLSVGSRLDIGPGHALPRLTYDHAPVGNDGAFEVRNIPPGDRIVVVGGKHGTYQLAQVELGPGQTVNLGELPVPVAGMVEGTVSDGEGHPVEEGHVIACRREIGLSFWTAAPKPGKQERTAVGLDGCYSFGELGSGFWHLMAVCPSWTSAGIKRIFVNGGRQEVDFTYSCSGRITGSTVDAAGKPLATTRITCEGRTLKSRLETETDEAGRFDIRGLPSGSYTITSTHQWCLRSPARVVEVDENASPASVEFVLEWGGTIRGLLLGADGQPVRAARDEWEIQVGMPWTEEPSAYLMDDGTVRTRVLAPGTYFLRARRKSAADDVPWAESEPIGVYVGQASTQAVIELPGR